MDHTLMALTSYEIPTVIQKASVFGGQISQPSSTKRPSSLITRLDVDQSGLMLMKLQDVVTFEKKRPVSIKLNYRNLSFSLAPDEYSVDGHTIIGHVPVAAKAIALRDAERYAFPLDKKIWGLVHRVENRSGHLDARIMLVDVSKSGLGVIIPDCNKNDFIANDHVWVKSLNGINLQVPIFGRIIYTYERKFRDSVDLKCGIALDSPLSEDVYADLQRECRLVLRG